MDHTIMDHTPSYPRRRALAVPTLLLGLLVAAPAVLAPAAHAQSCPAIVHVDASATGAGDGASWAGAFTKLQDGLTLARSCAPTTTALLVAEGVYYPDEGTGLTDDDRTATFALIDGVTLEGGYPSGGGLRDWQAHPTVLSGDVGQDDVNTDGNHVAETTGDLVDDNSYNVLKGRNLSPSTVLDGFTVTAGQANLRGGGFYNDGSGSGNESSPTIRNAAFSGNFATFDGGAVYNNAGIGGTSSPSFTNATFSGNSTFYGGGGAVYNNGGGPNDVLFGTSSPSFTNVTFSGNSARGSGGAVNNFGSYGHTSSPSFTDVTFSGNSAQTGGGGAVYNYGFRGTSSPTFTNVTFSGNTAREEGGAVHNHGYEGTSSPAFTNATFYGNSSPVYYGGAVYNLGAAGGTSSPTFTNATFSGNSAYAGGAVYNNNDGAGTVGPTFVNSILWANTASYGSQIHNRFGTPSLSYTLVQGGCGGSGFGGSATICGAGNLDADPLFVGGGDLRLQAGSPAIDAGDNGAVAGVTTDLDGNDRIFGGAVDMGPYEYALPPNAAPVITGITVPADPVAVDADAAVSASFTDPDAGDAHACTVDYGDGTPAADGTVSGLLCTGTHAYSAAGVYTVTLTVTDAAGESDTEAATDYVVVYDPAAGFVTGNGWIDSPAGAYAADPTLTGQARFGFVSKYKRGQSTPDGRTQFKFNAAGFTFKSTAYEWLVIAGPNAKFKGTGTINDAGDYGFMLTATDGDPDRFRIKVWDADDAVVYDNQLGEGDDSNAGTELGGGQVMIHRTGGSSATGGTSASRGADDAAPTAFALSAAYPNPFAVSATVAFDVPEAAHVRLVVYDVLGREVAVLVDESVEAGTHAAAFDGRGLPSGTYLVRMTTDGGFAQTQRITLMR